MRKFLSTSILFLLTIIVTIPSGAVAQDSLINVIQWTEASGGNGHWYGIIPTVQSWNEHDIAAGTYWYANLQGHLATIGSAEENQFIVDSILTRNTDQPSGIDQFMIGATYMETHFQWVTFEPFTYFNWADSEPNGDGWGMAMYGASYPEAGQWNDVADWGVDSLTPDFWGLIEFGIDSTTPPPPPPDTVITDTVINLVQWTSAMGGNDHWYGIIPIVQDWISQDTLASTLTYDGMPGHLATIGSMAENQFVMDSLLAGNTGQPSIADEFYLGGHRNGLDWGWTTGEDWSYSNWNVGEPSGDGLALAIWGASEANYGEWNDVPEYGSSTSIHRLWALIEFGVDAGVADSLIIPSLSVATGSNLQPVQSKTTQSIKGVTVPLQIPVFARNFGISTEGLITENWDFQITQIKEDSGFILVALFNTFGAVIPAGTNTLFNISFEASSPFCDQDLAVHWDTTLMRDASRQLIFSDTNTLPVYPGFDVSRDSLLIQHIVVGDADNSGAFDISDLLFAVDFMFTGGPAPVNPNALDVNGDCSGPDVSDLLRMVDHMFLMNNTTLECGCIASAKRADYDIDESMSLYTAQENGKTALYIHSGEPVRGVQFELSVTGDAEPVKSVSENIEMVYGVENNILRTGLLDLNGFTKIDKGDTKLIEVDGTASLVSGLVANNKNQAIIPLINNKSEVLPTDYALSQNYPNPFNPTTEIQFSIPQHENVSLVVYNIAGQKVKTLLNGEMEAGRHQVTWDGTDNAGNQVASGIYLYRLDVNQFSQNKKMILLK